ncbi:MAG: transcription termination factor Rho, partial [Actinomycetota bacterium]
APAAIGSVGCSGFGGAKDGENDGDAGGPPTEGGTGRGGGHGDGSVIVGERRSGDQKRPGPC